MRCQTGLKIFPFSGAYCGFLVVGTRMVAKAFTKANCSYWPSCFWWRATVVLDLVNVVPRYERSVRASQLGDCDLKEKEKERERERESVQERGRASAFRTCRFVARVPALD